MKLIRKFQMSGADQLVISTARDLISFTQSLTHEFEIDIDDEGALSIEVYVERNLTLYISLEHNGGCVAGLVASGGEIKEYFSNFSLQLFQELKYWKN